MIDTLELSIDVIGAVFGLIFIGVNLYLGHNFKEHPARIFFNWMALATFVFISSFVVDVIGDFTGDQTTMILHHFLMIIAVFIAAAAGIILAIHLKREIHNK